jgi:hypothetical protein
MALPEKWLGATSVRSNETLLGRVSLTKCRGGNESLQIFRLNAQELRHIRGSRDTDKWTQIGEAVS